MFNIIFQFLKYRIIKNSRKKILIKEINKLINFQSKLTIVDYGSGYDCYISRKLKKVLNERGIKTKFICYDNFEMINKNLNFKNKFKDNDITIKNINNDFDVEKCDYLMVNDVLHHIDSINYSKLEFIFEKFFNKSDRIILKDHFQTGFFSNIVLQFMDYIGNSYYGLKTPKEYFNKKNFDNFLLKKGYFIEKKCLNIRYYSKYLLFFSNPDLHFIYLITKNHKS
jgi:hypothetical protein